MIKISKLADYAVVILSEMARDGDALYSTSHLAESITLGEATVAKVMKLLTKGGVVSSVRGVNGGYRLAHTPDDITIAAIVESIDGRIALTACADSVAPDCSLAGRCGLRGRWDGVNTAIRSALEAVSLADMTADNMNSGKAA